jgi:hypothetical protein
MAAKMAISAAGEKRRQRRKYNGENINGSNGVMAWQLWQ